MKKYYKSLLLIIAFLINTQFIYPQWVSTNGPSSNTIINCLAVSGTNVFAGTAGAGVYYSSNYGTNWIGVNSGITDSYIQCLAVNGNYIYAGTPYGGVFRSMDNGASWTQVNNGLTITNILSFAALGNYIFAGSYGGGVFLSTNFGDTWIQKNNGLVDIYIRSLAVSGNNIFAGTSAPGGVFFSTNNGTNWTQVINGLSNTYIWSLAIKDTNIFAGSGGGGVYHSTNNGTSWTRLTNGLSLYSVISIVISDTNIFAGGFEGLSLSTNSGASWTGVNTGFNTEDFSLAVSGSNIFAGASNEGGGPSGVFLSTNNGTNWKQLGLNNAPFVYSLYVSGNNILAGIYGGLYISTDNGTNWKQENDGLTSTNVYCIAVNETNIFIGNDSGVWTRPISELSLPVELISFNTNITNGIITLNWKTATETNNLGFNVELSSDKSNWTKIDFVQGHQNSTSINTYSYIDKSASHAGKYYYRLNQIDDNGSYKYSNIVEADLIPLSVFILNQNYPDPFNPNTVISYSLPVASIVKLNVYNTLGQTVKVLENSFKNAGNYSVNFNASELPSGTYFYKIEAGQFTQIKKMILIK